MYSTDEQDCEASGLFLFDIKSGTGRPLESPEDFPSRSMYLTYRPDGRSFCLHSGDVTHPTDARVVVIDVTTGAALSHTISSAIEDPPPAWSRDPRGDWVIVVRGDDGGPATIVEVLEVGTGRAPSGVTAMEHDGEVCSVGFSPDATKVVSVFRDAPTGRYKIRVREVLAGGPPVEVDTASTARLRLLDIGRDAGRIVTLAEDGTVNLWRAGPNRPYQSNTVAVDLNFGGRMLEARHTREAATLGLGESVLVTSSGYDVLVEPTSITVGWAKEVTLRMWDAEDYELIQPVLEVSLSSYVATFSIDVADLRLMIACTDGRVNFQVLVPRALGRVLARVGSPSPSWGAFTPDGRRLLAGSKGGLECWDVDSGNRLWAHLGTVDLQLGAISTDSEQVACLELKSEADPEGRLGVRSPDKISG